MFSEIITPNQEDFEFDLEGIDLHNFKLLIDSEEGVFICNDYNKFIIDDLFLKEGKFSILEETDSEPPLILNSFQKEEIVNLIKTHTNLLD